LVACLVLAPSAWAAPQPPRKVVAKSINNAAVDGGHFVAWSKQGPDAARERPGRVVVLDERTWSRKTIELGRACLSTSVADGHEGRFLISCAVGGNQYTRILDARTGEVKSLTDDRAYCDHYGQIGRYWLEGMDNCTAHQVVIYTNWHTGEGRSDGLLLGEERPPYNLDRPDLPVIGPLSRLFQTEGPLVLNRSRVTRNGRDRDLIHLLRPGNKPQQLGSCRSCLPVSLKARLAIWQDYIAVLAGSGTSEAYAIATGRRLHWRLGGNTTLLGATTKRVYFLAQHKANGPTSALKSFRWP
jgi:hypothetical protein